jgi:hypothetical protein
VQIAGNGYVESRHHFFNAAGRLTVARIDVVWSDGTMSDMLTILHQDSFEVQGSVQYPDNTRIAAQYFPDGRAHIIHSTTQTGETVVWDYQPNGSGTVEQMQFVDLGSRVGHSVTRWSVDVDGSAVGDVWEDLDLTDSQTGEQTKVETRRAVDGTVTTRLRIWAANGDLLRDDTTTIFPHSRPEPEPPTSPMPTPPAPSGGDGSPVGVITPTTRSPDPSITGGGGWSGPGGFPTVEHWLDWWYETTDGRIIYLGSTLKTKEA